MTTRLLLHHRTFVLLHRWTLHSKQTFHQLAFNHATSVGQSIAHVADKNSFRTRNIPNPSLNSPIARHAAASTDAASSKFLRKRKQRHANNAYIQRNKRIVALGKGRDWKGILKVYVETNAEQKYDNINYATTMSQLGRIVNVNHQDPMLLKFVDDLCQTLELQGMDWFGSRETANVVHAIGKMRLRTDSARRILEFVASKENACVLVEKGTPQNVANTVWAFAKLGMQSPKLFSEIEKCAKELVEKGKPQEVANTAWAFAKLGIQSPSLFSEIEKHAKELVESGTPQEVANTAWASAKLGIQSPSLFSEIDKYATELVEKGTPQNVANTVWAFAKLGIQSPSLFSEIDKYATELVEKGTPHDVSNTAWAFATLGIQSHRLFSEIEKHAKELVESRKTRDVANTAWAFAKLGIQSPRLFSEIEKHAMELVEKGSPQNVANTAWAFALCDFRIPKALHAYIVQQDRGLYTNEELQQLAQVISLSHVSKTQPLKPSLTLYSRMQDLSPDDENRSTAQSQVSSLLAELGFDHERDVSPFPIKKFNLPKSMLSIDLACRDSMIAIEFDGPSRFLRSLDTGEITRHENGATKAKRRLLGRLGWKVINIHYKDWEKAGTQAGKLSFLHSVLVEAGFAI